MFTISAYLLLLSVMMQSILHLNTTKQNFAEQEEESSSKDSSSFNGLGDNNLYFMDTVNFGEYGGICTCPDGTSYRVSDSKNDCLTLNCFGGGTVSQCHPNYEPKWQHMGVICGGKKVKNTILKSKDEEFSRSEYSIGAQSKIKIEYNNQIVCANNPDRNMQSECTPFLKCYSSNDSGYFSCVLWDNIHKSVEMFFYKGCIEDNGNVYCEGLVEGECSVGSQIWKDGGQELEKTFHCKLDAPEQEKMWLKDCYQMPNATNIVKCCNVDWTLDDTNCYNFKLTSNSNITGQLDEFTEPKE